MEKKITYTGIVENAHVDYEKYPTSENPTCWANAEIGSSAGQNMGRIFISIPPEWYDILMDHKLNITIEIGDKIEH